MAAEDWPAPTEEEIAAADGPATTRRKKTPKWTLRAGAVKLYDVRWLTQVGDMVTLQTCTYLNLETASSFREIEPDSLPQSWL